MLAIVCETDPGNLLTPTVKTFYCTRRKQRTEQHCINLAEADKPFQIQSPENPSDWPFTDLNELWLGNANNSLSDVA